MGTGERLGDVIASLGGCDPSFKQGRGDLLRGEIEPTPLGLSPLPMTSPPFHTRVTSTLLSPTCLLRSKPWMCAAMKSAAPQIPLGRRPVCIQSRFML